MRVLHFYKTSLPDTVGGIEQVINQLARGMVQYGVQTDVLSLTTNKSPKIIEIDGYRVHRAALDFQIASTGFSFSVISRFAKLVKEADVIHYHFPWPFMDFVHICTRVKKPAIVTYHSDIIRQKKLLKVYRPLQNLFLNNIKKIVATSPNYLGTSKVLKKFNNKVEVIPIGLDKTSYPKPTTDKLKYWKEIAGEKFFLFVGVLRYYKGLHILLDAAKLAPFPILIVGVGPIEKELKKQVQQLGLKNVRFLGYLPDEDKVALLQLCFCVIFPSHLRSEAFGISLLEGAMYGKPMISSEIGTGTTYINIDRQTGLVVPPSDAKALSDAMCYLWNNPQKAHVMGENAEKRYWDYFTSARMLESYFSLYKKTLYYNK